ncbi:MAG: DUF4421 domain-containing protein [Bacteroidales bacterium]|nr:DUF4421 domain-containing protein [Bacteroidales bacterium]
MMGRNICNRCCSYLFGLLVLYLLSFISKDAQAQIDTTYIKRFKDKLTVRVYSLNEAATLVIDPLAEGPDLSYRPNSKQHFGVAAYYKWFGLGLAVQSPFANTNEDIYGDSKSIDIRLNVYGRLLNAELAYVNYRGFYLENTPKIIDSYLPGNPYFIRDDLTIESVSGLVYFVTNHRKHSFKAAYIQNEYQLKSSGSLIIAPAFQLNRLKADESLIPQDYIAKYDVFDEDKLVRGKFNVVGVFVGYSYTLVFLKRFYVNAAMLPGAFMQYYNYHTEENHYQKNNAYFLWTLRLAAGYNGKHWFAGMGGVSGFNTALVPIKTPAFALGIEQFRIWIGTRFAVGHGTKAKK